MKTSPRKVPFVIWLTGISGSGKSTIAHMLFPYLCDKGYRIEHLDGDTVRAIFPDTGFSKEERNNHIKRVGYLASLLEKNGIIVIASFISPYRESRDFVRKLCRNFIEVHVSASLKKCEERDVKGLYKKARAGVVKNFTGIDDPYEIPLCPELIVDTDNNSPEESFKYICAFLEKHFSL